MTHMRHVRRIVGIVTGMAASLVAAIAVAPSAFAMVDPPPGGPLYGRFGPMFPANLKHPPAPVHAHTAVTIGMPGWQIALIAVGAALVAAALAVLLDRVWVSRRHPTPTHA